MEPHPFSPLYLVGAILLALHYAALGQNPAAAEVRRTVADQSGRPQFRSVAGGVALRQESVHAQSSASGVGSEFGEQRIVQRRAQVEPWTAIADVQLFSTDNVALTPTYEQRDWYLRYGLAISYTNRIKGPLFIDLSLQQYLFRYAKFSSLDFDLTRFEGGFLFQAPWLADAFFFARYNFQRITESGFGTEYFASHSADLGVQKVWKISRGQQVFAGISANLGIDTTPSASGRNEYSATLGYTARLTESLTAGLSCRGAALRYGSSGVNELEGARTDWNLIVALGLTYDVTDWLRLGANVSYLYNDSNAALANYDNFVAGCGISLRMSF